MERHLPVLKKITLFLLLILFGVGLWRIGGFLYEHQKETTIQNNANQVLKESTRVLKEYNVEVPGADKL